MKALNVIDLFSGLGGASAAFADRGHEVIRYDNNPVFKDVPFTTIMDLHDIKVSELRGQDLIEIGFPCTHFTIARVSETWPNGRPTRETQLQIDFLKMILAKVRLAKPRFWVLENPRGKMRSVIGKPNYETAWCAWYSEKDEHMKGPPYPKKPTDIWGCLPPIERRIPTTWIKSPRGSRTGTQGESAFNTNTFAKYGQRLSSLRSLWPYEFSLALCLAAEGRSNQMMIPDYF